jgi:hypothetical protein
MSTKSAFKGMLAWMAIVLNVSGCSGQPRSEGRIGSSDTVAQYVDTPTVDIRVNKQYDEHGNLIAYDSSYTSFYRSHAGDAAFMDSVFKDFMPGFGKRFPFLNDPGFNSLFFPDSSFHRDFFNPDFFQKRMEMNQRYLRRMMEQMDSLKNQHFFRNGWPPHRGTAASLPGGSTPGNTMRNNPGSGPHGNGDTRQGRQGSAEL